MAIAKHLAQRGVWGSPRMRSARRHRRCCGRCYWRGYTRHRPNEITPFLLNLAAGALTVGAGYLIMRAQRLPGWYMAALLALLIW